MPSSPDEEAMRLMRNVAHRAQVARSFAKLAGGLLTVKLTEMKRLAQAAKEAAVLVATHRSRNQPEP